jgi:hypothetical protein
MPRQVKGRTWTYRCAAPSGNGVRTTNVWEALDILLRLPSIFRHQSLWTIRAADNAERAGTVVVALVIRDCSTVSQLLYAIRNQLRCIPVIALAAAAKRAVMVVNAFILLDLRMEEKMGIESVNS